MAGYVIADVNVLDPVKYEEYRKLVMPTLANYGGEFVVRGGEHETLEGAWQPGRLVILRFESVERAKAWWSSAEYDGPKALRQSASEGSLVVVEGT
jgi:uncharacterized protein (DUF1330 family)